MNEKRSIVPSVTIAICIVFKINVNRNEKELYPDLLNFSVEFAYEKFCFLN